MAGHGKGYPGEWRRHYLRDLLACEPHSSV